MDVGIIIIGVLLIIQSLTFYTENFKSTFVFKILPFFSGLYLLVYYAKVNNFITF